MKYRISLLIGSVDDVLESEVEEVDKPVVNDIGVDEEAMDDKYL